MIECPSIDAILALAGQPAQHSAWTEVSQEMVDRFADLTGDRQWIHVDPERAGREGPFGGTIAHGFLTLALLGGTFGQCYAFPNRRFGLNYGFDKVRFVSAVRVGQRVRAGFSLQDAKLLAPDTVQCSWEARIEVEGENKPAVSANWVLRYTY